MGFSSKVWQKYQECDATMGQEDSVQKKKNMKVWESGAKVNGKQTLFMNNRFKNC